VANTSHGAAPSALGYQHQTWWALLELLRAGDDRPDGTIALELYDDVSWEEHGTPTELLQLKHHRKGSRLLTDRSPDVWDTLKVWMDTAAPEDPAGPTLVLVTTQTAKSGSAIAALRPQSRDEAWALEALETVALDAQSDATGRARRQFLALGSLDRQTFLSKIRVVDDSDHIQDIPAAVRRALSWALPPGHEDAFLAQVWHWWDGQALAMLRRLQDGVEVGAAKAAIARIRDRFTQADLPTYLELADVDTSAVTAEHTDALFVQQMRWVGYPPRNLRGAVVDFYRATTQTIRWLDECLIGPEELNRVQEELVDEWDRAFEWMALGLGPNADEPTKQAAGRQLLSDLTERAARTVRPRYSDAYFTRGQRHILADSGQVGWHIDYADRIRTPRRERR